jgi:glycosyltransferase involved in cell wall biosynthesis
MSATPIVLDARTATNHFPGISRYVVNLAHALMRIAPDLNLVLLHDPSAASTRLVLPNLTRIECPVSPFSVRQQWSVPRQLRRAEVKLYHTPYYLMPYRPGVPAVFTCHDLIPLVYPQYFSATQRLIYRLANALALKTVSMTIVVSQATKADLLRYFRFDPQRITIIPEAADRHFCPQPPERIAAARNKYVLPERYVLYLGSNKPHKNLVCLVQAWQMENVKHPMSNTKLVIAGQWDGRYTEARRLVEELGMKNQVIFAGAVEENDLPALYSGAELFVFPSLYEGFGLPVLEAMACGTPVVCSSASSLPEVAGNAAILVPSPTQVDTLAAAIGQVLREEELRQVMRQDSLAQAARFSWERTAYETLAVYEHRILKSA